MQDCYFNANIIFFEKSGNNSATVPLAGKGKVESCGKFKGEWWELGIEELEALGKGWEMLVDVERCEKVEMGNR